VLGGPKSVLNQPEYKLQENNLAVPEKYIQLLGGPDPVPENTEEKPPVVGGPKSVLKLPEGKLPEKMNLPVVKLPEGKLPEEKRIPVGGPYPVPENKCGCNTCPTLLSLYQEEPIVVCSAKKQCMEAGGLSANLGYLPNKCKEMKEFQGCVIWCIRVAEAIEYNNVKSCEDTNIPSCSLTAAIV